ncbi:MAG: DUF4252 domain-containing protein [Bacteroidota bacterium]
MKKWILACCILSFALTSYAQTPTINKFYRQNKFKEGVRNISLPGWLIRLGSRIAKNKVEDDPEAVEALKLARKVRKMRLLVTEEGNPIKQQKIDKMMRNVRKKDKFEDLIYVRDESTEVNMLIRTNGSGDMIKNLLILVNDEEEFVFLSLKTKLGIQEINKLLRSLEDEVELDIEVPIPDPEPEEILAEEPQV